jgi:hypothetical protein
VAGKRAESELDVDSEGFNVMEQGLGSIDIDSL